MAMRALVLVAKSQMQGDGLVAEALLRTAMSTRLVCCARVAGFGVLQVLVCCVL